MKGSVRRRIVATVVAGIWSTLLAGTAAAYAIERDFGSPADGSSSFARTIDITPETHWVNVDQNEVVRFLDVSSGKSFYWRFDTAARVVELNKIAPTGFLPVRRIDAYVKLPPAQD